MSETKTEYIKPQKELIRPAISKAHWTNFALIIFCTVQHCSEFHFVLIDNQSVLLLNTARDFCSVAL
jgi:hypothetical protein